MFEPGTLGWRKALYYEYNIDDLGPTRASLYVGSVIFGGNARVVKSRVSVSGASWRATKNACLRARFARRLSGALRLHAVGKLATPKQSLLAG